MSRLCRLMAIHTIVTSRRIERVGNQCSSTDDKAVNQHYHPALGCRQNYANHRCNFKTAKFLQDLGRVTHLAGTLRCLCQQLLLAIQTRIIQPCTPTHTHIQRLITQTMRNQAGRRRVTDTHLAETDHVTPRFRIAFNKCCAVINSLRTLRRGHCRHL